MAGRWREAKAASAPPHSIEARWDAGAGIVRGAGAG